MPIMAMHLIGRCRSFNLVLLLLDYSVCFNGCTCSVHVKRQIYSPFQHLQTIHIRQKKHATPTTSSATIRMHVFLSVGDVMETTTVIKMKRFMIHLMRKIVVSWVNLQKILFQMHMIMLSSFVFQNIHVLSVKYYKKLYPGRICGIICILHRNHRTQTELNDKALKGVWSFFLKQWKRLYIPFESALLM